MKKLVLLPVLVFALNISSCKKDDPQLGDPPTAADAEFTVQVSAENDNIIEFTAANSEVIAKWDLGNEIKAEGPNVVGLYPFAGTYTVTLTIFNSGGSISSSQEITIAKDDPTLLDVPIYNHLTGGASLGVKTWAIDSVTDGHMGVGPNPAGPAGETPEWWAAGGCDKKGVGLYDDRFTFSLIGFKFDMVTNGNIYINAAQEPFYPGAFQNLGDFTAPYDDQLEENWSVKEEEDGLYLTLTGDAFIGFVTGVRTYKVISHSDDKVVLRYLDNQDPGLAWYITLVPENTITATCDDPGGGGGGGGGADTNRYDLPIDFESGNVVFESFGGSSDTVIPNPDSSGINTSSMVLETVHGIETWAGVFVDLKTPLDFSTQTEIALKVWAPMGVTLRIKLEDSNNSNTFVEKDVTVNLAQTWEEVSIDFAGEPSGTYDRVVFFPGWGVASAGTFYLDDITQK